MTRRTTGPLVIAVAVTLVGVMAGSARAGTYDVLACDAAEGIGGGNFALEMSSDFSFENAIACPTDNTFPDGIISRNRLDAGKALWLRGARGTFTAPPGTTVKEVTWRGAMSRADCHWSLGIAANGQLLYGLGANSNCAQSALTQEATVAINAQSFVAGVACGDTAGCPTATTSSGWHDYTVAMRTHYLRIRVEDGSVPSVVNLGGPLAGGAWVRGTQAVSFDASDGAGIFLTRLRIATVERESTLRGGCDYRYPAPCQNVSGGGYSFNTAGLQDGEYEIAVEAVDPGGNVGAATAVLRADNNPPARPVALAVDGGDGWRGSNAFDVSWQNPPDQHAPVVAAHYAVCPGPDLQNCSSGSARGDGVTHLSGVQVPAPGDWMLRVWLEDAAGNVDEKTASDPVHLRFDDRPPEIAFNPQDPTDPRRVVATIKDPASGPATGTIELSRAGSGSWRAIATTLENGQLVAYLNDERLKDGRYLLRAQASDVAGNEGIGDRRTDGSAAEVVLPLRAATALRVGVPTRERVRRARRRGKRKWATKLKRHRRVRYGRSVLLKGRLGNGDAQPIVGQVLTVYGRAAVRGARFQPLGTVTTNARGGFRYRARALFNLKLRVYYPGTALIRSAAARASLTVPASASLHASRRRARNGQAVIFRGRFRAPPTLRAEKLVEVQAQVRDKWRPVAPAVRTDAAGRYAVRYRFRETSRTITYKFRARLARQKGYPYATGSSHRARVTVRAG